MVLAWYYYLMTFFEFLQLNSGAPAKRAKMNPSEDAAGGGGWGEESHRARAFRRSEAEAVSSVQKMFEQSCIIPP
jgi:hypothetical protein